MGIGNLDSIRSLYGERDKRLAGRDIYSHFSDGHLFAIQLRQRATLAFLKKQGLSRLENQQILDLGCGRGGVLHEYLSYGAQPNRIHGTDLLLGRLQAARTRLPHLPFTCADGQNLPYRDGIFDLVFQYTVFTSVLHDEIKIRLAREMLRVLKKPDGIILWYDFWVNPINDNTKGIRPAEVRKLFPSCSISFKRITLAPPIARKLVRFSWMACELLESLKLFNSHYLAVIRPNTG